jgi:hypothetical protein
MKNSRDGNHAAIDRTAAPSAPRHLQLAKPTNPAVFTDEPGVSPTTGIVHGPHDDEPVLTLFAC